MFEHRQEEMEGLLKSNANFRRLFNRHQELEKRVTEAEDGLAAMDDLALSQLKRQKLKTKDELTRIMDQAQAA